MRIVHWGKYYHPDVGGIESVTASLAMGAAAAGHRVSVICFAKDGLSDRCWLDGQVEVLRAPVRLQLSSQPLGLKYCIMLVRSMRSADMVQVHVPNMLAGFFALLLPRRIQLIVHWHSDVIGKGRLARWLKPVETMMLKRADSIVATSRRYAEASLALRPHLSKVSVVPIGVPDRSPDIADNACTLPDDLKTWLAGSPFILSVGRLVPYKGFDVLVDAARHMSRAKVVIVGKGPLDAELRKKVEAVGLGSRVRIAGYLPAAALDTLWRHASLYCLSSVERSEAFGVVLPEAMAYGLPIVATDIPGSGVPWVNAQGVSGINVPPGDAVALAEACEDIMASVTLRLQLSSGSRSRFEDEFEQGKSVKRMIAIYDQLKDGPPAGFPV